jgi:hypothetical protein
VAATETPFVPRPLFSGRADIIAAPFPWLFTGEDNLRVVIVNSVPGVAVTVHGRFLQAGSIIPGSFSSTFTPTSARLPSTFDMSVGVGSMLNCAVQVTSGAPLIGQTYVMMQVIRGTTGATVVLGCLFAGYVTAMQHLAYPGSAIESSIEGGYSPRMIIGTQPALGAEINESVPTGARWRLASLRVNFTTSATPGSRQARLLLNFGGSEFLTIPLSRLTPANQGDGYEWAVGFPEDAVSWLGYGLGPLVKDMDLLGGTAIRTQTTFLQAGDQYGAPNLYLDEWLEAA